jgi:hypothetical protein
MPDLIYDIDVRESDFFVICRVWGAVQASSLSMIDFRNSFSRNLLLQCMGCNWFGHFDLWLRRVPAMMNLPITLHFIHFDMASFRLSLSAITCFFFIKNLNQEVKDDLVRREPEWCKARA